MIQLPEMPSQIARLPRDHRGYPVPYFVEWVDGKPLFPVMNPDKLVLAVRERRCWVCGDRLGRNVSFVIGPMCSINRISAEPPNHLECATFSVKACPFLTKPKMKRQDVEGVFDAPGIMLKRNPGVACIWTTRSFEIVRVDNGVLFQIGDPTHVEWYAEGREASRAEVMESIDSGLPLLKEPARQEGPEAELALEKMRVAAMRFLPTEMQV